MAVNIERKRRKSDNIYKNCPKAILNVVPEDCLKLPFSDLKTGEVYQDRAIVGKICHLNPIGKRRGGYVRKLLISDALADEVESQLQLPVFLLDEFAQDSETAEMEGFIVIVNFAVEASTQRNKNHLPFQILVNNETSNVWFGRKVAKIKSKKKLSVTQKKKKISREEENEDPVILSNHYDYTKLGDLKETESKETYNVYGIVDKCNLKVPLGKQLQILELQLTDETEVGFSCAVFASKDEKFPDVYPGDIVRIHRMQVSKFRSKLNGKCASSAFILVFSKCNGGDKPRTVAKSFTLTSDDMIKVKELFEWYQKQSEPKLICEIEKDDFVNIICQVIGVYIARTTEAVVLKVWDGTRTSIFPGSHWGLKGEKLDQKLFTYARSYYVVLSAYGQHAVSAGELEPGQYIEVRDAHLYVPNVHPDECKLCIHAGDKEGRGIFVLDTDAECVIKLRERLEKIISEAHEFGSQTDDLLSQNNSIFLNCDISVMPSQKSQELTSKTGDADEAINVDDAAGPSDQDNEKTSNEDVDALNRTLTSRNDQGSSQNTQNTVVSVLDAAVKPGQSTQEFGEGMQREFQNMELPQDVRLSATSEPDPLINLTPMEVRYFFHDPLKKSSQASLLSDFPDATQGEWWKLIPALSVTDGHSNINPSSISEIVQHSVPYKFRVFAAVLCFKPETTTILNLIHLYCPQCHFLSKDASPSYDSFEEKDGIPYVYCPECSNEESDMKLWPILEYTFLITFSLHDGSGSHSIEAYLWKENAVNFFKNITPEDAIRCKATANTIMSMLWSICPNCRPSQMCEIETRDSKAYPILDCCVLSYTTINGTHYQIFDTKLL